MVSEYQELLNYKTLNSKEKSTSNIVNSSHQDLNAVNELYTEIKSYRDELAHLKIVQFETLARLDYREYHLQQQTQSQLQQTQSKLERSQSIIAGIKSSKFWKLRNYWFAFKKIVGIKTDD